uniref:Uncharacterized protein n=1 Tax=Magallana gigas TaxID=29159 RepID=A0A8W8JE64_MAGGI
MPSLSLAVSVILLVLMTKVCIIRGSCSNRQTSDCCSTGYFYDSVSRKCMDALSTTGGSLVYASDQETGSVSGSKQINLETKISPDVVATPVLVTTVVVLLVVLVAIVSRYTWRKKPGHSDETNENLYDELDEKKMDAAKEKNEKGPKTLDKTLQNDYIDSLALKKRQSDRESKHFYDPLK